MKSKYVWIAVLSVFGTVAVLAQAPAAPQQGPGVQAPQDARYAEWVVTLCKTPPPQRGAGGNRGPAPAGLGAAGQAPAGAAAGGAARGGAAAPANAAAGPPAHRDYAVTEIPGVIAAGARWRSLWTGTGNNADGIIATSDGIFAAQNTNSTVLRLDRNDMASIAYRDTNTGGALSMNKSGALFVVQRGLPASVVQIAPVRRVLADTYNGEPLDCIGGVINDLTADSRGGVYFTMGGLFYANPQGVVSRYGENLQTNGVVLSPDERTLYVTTRGVVAFDVQPDGSLTNQRQFATVGNDGLSVDSAGRLYATNGPDIQVIAPDGKVLGAIPLPLNFITAAFGGPDKRTLYGVANNQRFTEIFSIPMLAQGYAGRAK